ncbi:hypothetical protein BTN49_1529 [Candidatus Enterovibrio escicola]|uniref:Uncharacterized protein n=1 Tax=Candidatus Enterovibrio escicola TaxID=1927127 RepID=A0A2A5T4A2_9GAMM|nr:hypothetical protein BTN49_1529 [Candidatus Enterovibrio escacola]
MVIIKNNNIKPLVSLFFERLFNGDIVISGIWVGNNTV